MCDGLDKKNSLSGNNVHEFHVMDVLKGKVIIINVELPLCKPTDSLSFLSCNISLTLF